MAIKANLIHPQQKPVELLSYMIRTYTDEGDLVLDPFGGSGSTEIAAIRTNRQCISYELDPDIYAVASERIAAEQRVSRLF